MGARLPTAVVGATGYSGFELARLLLRHPCAGVRLFARETTAGAQDLAEVFPHVAGNGNCPIEPFSWAKLAEAGVELLFLATPHEVSREWVPEAIGRGLRVIDLSGAWRLKQAENRAIYQFDDRDPAAAAAQALTPAWRTARNGPRAARPWELGMRGGARGAGR